MSDQLTEVEKEIEAQTEGVEKPEGEKIKLMVFSDHPLSKSGIGIQASQLIQGLLDTGRYSVYSIGAAVKHQDQRIQSVEPYGEDWLIQPVEGFGNQEMMRQWLVSVKPDAVLFFTDPRFFIWAFEMEEEIRDVCPIVFWTVWDCEPAPKYNKPIYDCCDDIAWFSQYSHDFHLEVEMDANRHCVQLARKHDEFYRESDEAVKQFKVETLGFENRDAFVGLFVSRNARRKRPADVIWSWKRFVDGLPEDKRDGAVLIMHTDPNDQEGPNLIHVLEQTGMQKNVKFSPAKFTEEIMRKLYTMADVTLNLSLNEGFGMSVHESLLCETPVICTKTGGMPEQMTDGEVVFGRLVEPDTRMLVGSQMVPYIYEDIVSVDTFASKIREVYDLTREERKSLGTLGRKFITKNFRIENIVSAFDKIFTERVQEYREPRLRAQLIEL